MDCPGRFGQYDLIRRIAVGGMAEIYLAKVGGLAGFEKHLVLKVIHPKFAADPEFVEMLVHEAKLAVRLTHANIAQVFDLGVLEDRYFIALEYVDGLDVFQFLRRLREARAETPFSVAAFIVSEACAALDYAHNRRDEMGRALGIIHRDISPQNVLLSFEGDVKVIDFGIAKVKASSQSTAAGIIKGKFFYMSPEQARGQDLDHRSDIFAVGALFYELLTLRMLYDTESINDALRLAKRGAFLPPSAHRPDLPAALDKIALKTLARDRKHRYQSAGELRDDLNSWLRKASPGFGRHRLEGHLRDICGVNTQIRLARLRRNEFRVRHHRSMILRDDPTADLDGREPDEETREISPSINRHPEMVAEPPRGRADDAAEALARRIREARENLRWTDEHDLPESVADFDFDAADGDTYDVYSRATTLTQVKPDDLADDQPTRPRPEVRIGDQWPGRGVQDDTLEHTPATRRRQRRSEAPSNDLDPPTRPFGGGYRPPEGAPFDELADADETVVDPGPLRRALEEAEEVMRHDEVDPTPQDSLFEGTTNPYQRRRKQQRQRQRLRPPARPPKPPPRRPLSAETTSPPKRRPAPAATTAPRAPDERPIQRAQDSGEDFRDATWPEPISGAIERPRRPRRALFTGVGVAVLAAGIAFGLLIGPGAVQPVPDGSLFITSRPQLGAVIFIDGERTEFTTPAVIHQLQGDSSHDIRVVLAGYEPATAPNVVVAPETQTEVVMNLTPANYSATIESAPSGAEIVVDGHVVGQTPATIRDLEVSTDGALTVLLRLSGHLDSVFTLRWPEGESHINRSQNLTPSE